MFAKWKSTLLSLAMILTLGLVSSCGSNTGTNVQIAGVKGPNVTLLADSVLISMVLENVQMDGGLRYNIPKYVNSYLEVSPDAASGGTLMSVSVSLKDLLNSDLQKLDPQKLPGGRNLPGITTGALPAVAFSIQKFNNMSFYIGPQVFAIFVPVDVGVDGAIASFRYYVNSAAAGTISIVGKDANGANSGMLLMLNMTTSVKQAMMKIDQRYK